VARGIRGNGPHVPVGYGPMLLGSSDATGSNESWHRADATPAHDKHGGVEGQGYMTTVLRWQSLENPFWVEEF